MNNKRGWRWSSKHIEDTRVVLLAEKKKVFTPEIIGPEESLSVSYKPNIIETSFTKLLDGELYGENLIKGRYVTNAPIWVMDTTKLGNHYDVFVIQDLGSRAALTFCIVDGNKLTATNIATAIDLTITNFDCVPKIIHGDNCPLYTQNVVRQVFDAHGIQLSLTKNSKHNNQTIESFFNCLKGCIIKLVMNYEYELWQEDFFEKGVLKRGL